MRKVFFFLCLLFCGITNPIFAQYTTDSARVYLITASPGRETYAAFGHSFLRIADPSQGYDYAYNWGTFDFDTENFYIRFATGKLMYFLSINDFYYSLEYYRMVGQAIYMQEIVLTNKEKFNLINNIQINNQEENRSYRYDFFRDNCATRIRDIVVKSMEGNVVFDSAYVDKRESFRNLFGEYFKNAPWNFFGLNLIMGKSTDSIASVYDYMYLPEHLQNLFASAKVSGPDGTRNLTKAQVELFPSAIVVEKPSVFASPFFICMLAFLVVAGITFWEYRKRKHFKWLDVSLFVLTGFLGILITWLWGWSLHIYVHNNFHIVWASPLNFVAAVLLIFRPANRLRYYFGFYAALVLVMIPVSFFIVQEIPVASYFLMGMMIVRAAGIYFRKSLPAMSL